MRVMVMVKATADSEAGSMPDTELLAAMGRFNEALVQAGVMLAGEGLHPSARGKRVRFSGKDRTVIDGPFAETKELVAGFWVWQVRSMEEAVEWVKRCPNPMPGESEIEIRPVFEAEDFGDELTPELRAQEERVRAQAAGHAQETGVPAAPRGITPCLWFDTQAEEAARQYVSIFPHSRVTAVKRYGEAGREIHGKPAGSVLTVAFELEGQPFTALNGGPQVRFSEAISLIVHCDSQAEIDHYWQRLGEGGEPRARQCGWLKDRYGVSWQIVPRALERWIGDGDAARSDRVMAALLGMEKLDIAALESAWAGR